MSTDMLTQLPKDLDDSAPGENRTTEEIVADMVARNPKHSTPVQLREQIAVSIARHGAKADILEQRVYEARVEQIGGDPDELLPGNKPRFTMNEDFYIKDHSTGIVYPYPTGGAGGSPDEPAGQAECAPDAHDFPEPVEAQTVCTKCGLTFVEWATR